MNRSQMGSPRPASHCWGCETRAARRPWTTGARLRVAARSTPAGREVGGRGAAVGPHSSSSTQSPTGRARGSAGQAAEAQEAGAEAPRARP
eukprot:8840592-Pyramimonas_sp.AAC.1